MHMFLPTSGTLCRFSTYVQDMQLDAMPIVSCRPNCSGKHEVKKHARIIDTITSTGSLRPQLTPNGPSEPNVHACVALPTPQTALTTQVACV